MISQTDELAALEEQIRALAAVIADDPADQAMTAIKAAEGAVGAIQGASSIKSKLSRARRALKGDAPKRDTAAAELAKGLAAFEAEVAWRRKASKDLAPGLETYDDAIRHTIGLRQQERLTSKQAEEVASCLSVHRDISLSF